MELTVILDAQEEGGFTVYVPSLPGCISQGNTKEEALKNIKEAIELYVEEMGLPEGFKGKEMIIASFAIKENAKAA